MVYMKYTLYAMLYMYMLHIRYSAQNVVQCTSIVGVVASAAVSSDGSYSH